MYADKQKANEERAHNDSKKGSPREPPKLTPCVSGNPYHGNPQNLLRAFCRTLFPVPRTVIHSLAAASLPTGEGFWLCFIPLRHTSCATSPGGRGLSSADSLHGGALGYTSITLFKADLCCKKARTQKTPFKLNGVFTVSYLIYLSILRYILIRGGFLQSHHRLQCGLHRRK